MRRVQWKKYIQVYKQSSNSREKVKQIPENGNELI